MKLHFLADMSLLSKNFVKENKEKTISVRLENLPVGDFKPDVVREYFFDNVGHIYSVEQKVLFFRI